MNSNDTIQKFFKFLNFKPVTPKDMFSIDYDCGLLTIFVNYASGVKCSVVGYLNTTETEQTLQVNLDELDRPSKVKLIKELGSNGAVPIRLATVFNLPRKEIEEILNEKDIS